MREVLFEHQTEAGQIIRVVRGDLTDEQVDAIVNAANEYLAHGGGVAGAIVRRGGYSIQEESNRWVREHGPVRTGTAAITGAGNLPCRYVIHAVGPVWRERGDEPALLASAVRSALLLAAEHGLRSVSMPGISSGIFGFPKPLCAEVMLSTVQEFLTMYPESSVKEVNLCNIDRHTADIFAEEARRRFGAK
ncbi:MAG: macro domain-containing protein [Anaerolineae bacterium]|nr:macro domain-containing protein [Anaerolineae bacterium]MDH7473023.1 macro domain-containing protein [Anaerolineae bacterium]